MDRVRHPGLGAIINPSCMASIVMDAGTPVCVLSLCAICASPREPPLVP